MAQPSRVLLLTRSGCHLCVEAEAVVRRVCEELGSGWRFVDIDSDDALKAGYNDHVPVTFVDGTRFSYWFVDEGALREALAAPPPDDLSVDWTSTLVEQP